MDRKEVHKRLLSSSAYWGLPSGTNWPDCGAVSEAEPRHSELKITEDTLRVMAFSAIAGLQIIDRLPDESFQDFRARIDSRMSTPE
jgi:hypothetical protein